MTHEDGLLSQGTQAVRSVKLKINEQRALFFRSERHGYCGHQHHDYIGREQCLRLRWMKALLLFLVFIGLSMMIAFLPFAFTFDLASKAADTTVQSPQWGDFLVRITLLTVGGLVAMVVVIDLLERILGSEPFF